MVIKVMYVLQSLAKRLKMCKDKVYAINQLKEITD